MHYHADQCWLKPGTLLQNLFDQRAVWSPAKSQENRARSASLPDLWLIVELCALVVPINIGACYDFDPFTRHF
jgi:hypothetical protein